MMPPSAAPGSPNIIPPAAPAAIPDPMLLTMDPPASPRALPTSAPPILERASPSIFPVPLLDRNIQTLPSCARESPPFCPKPPMPPPLFFMASPEFLAAPLTLRICFSVSFMVLLMVSIFRR